MKSKRSPLFWLVGCGVLVVGCSCVGLGGMFAVGTLSSVTSVYVPTPRTAAADLPGGGLDEPVSPPPTTAGSARKPAATVTGESTARASAARSTQAVATPVASRAVSTPTSRPRSGTRGDSGQQSTVLNQTIGFISDDYVYPDYGGVDLKRESARIGGLISSGLSSEDFHAEMKGLIERLNDHHSVFLTPIEVKDEESRSGGFGTYVGFGLDLWRSDDNTYAYLTQVLPGSPAAKAGLKQHEHILRVDGKSVIGSDGRLINFGGPVGSTAVFSVRSPGGATREVTVSRATLENRSRVEARLLPSAGNRKIGYLYIPGFDGRTISTDTRAGLRDLMNGAGGTLDGLIIDMRNNGGGDLPVLQAHLGLFTAGVVGYGIDREGKKTNISCTAETIGNSQSVPLVILTGKLTASFGEVFAGALQGSGRAKTVGQASSGLIEELLPYDFTDGSELLLAIRTFYLPNGTTWARKGLQPNIPVSRTWEQVTVEDDEAISAALVAVGSR